MIRLIVVATLLLLVGCATLRPRPAPTLKDPPSVTRAELNRYYRTGVAP
jgi:hypothetical protein